MELCGGFLAPAVELSSSFRASVSIWMLQQMNSHVYLLVLSSLAVSSQLGLEDIFFSPQNQTAMEGEGVFLQCVSGESTPPASITWLKDGTLFVKGRQVQGSYGGGTQRKTSGTLHLFNITLEDDGMYKCVTHNRLLNISRESKAAKLTVLGVPRRLQITQGPDNITVAMGTQVFMHCAVRGFPVPMVHWFKDGCVLTNCSTSFSLQDNGQLLVFRNVTKEDEGSYHCEAFNQREMIKSQSAFLLPAEMNWTFVQQPSNLTVTRGENATVICRPPYSRPTAQVSWFKNNQLLTAGAHVSVLPSGDLFFHSVQESDSGSYFCRASNTHLHRFVTSRRATLTVLSSPSVRLWPQVLTVPVGARVVLECQVSGHPPPSISWVKRGHSKQTGGKIVMGLKNATLKIMSVRTYDEGVYVCEASNTLGQSQSSAALRVAVSPIIVNFTAQVNSRMGASVVLPCRAVGILPITYTWTRAGTHSFISRTEHRSIDEDGALHISNVQQSDVGEYYCTAENRAGQQQRRTALTVSAEDSTVDRQKQTRPGLSATTNISRDLPIPRSGGSINEQHPTTTHNPHVQIRNKEATCSTSHCDAATTYSTSSNGTIVVVKGRSGSLKPHSQQPTTNPTQTFVTQMQPPILPPPPHLKAQSADIHTQLPLTSAPLLTSNTEPTATDGQQSVVSKQIWANKIQSISPRTQVQQQSIEQLTQSINPVSLSSQITDSVTEKSPSKLPLSRPTVVFSYLQTESRSPVSQTDLSHSYSVTLLSSASQDELHRSQSHPKTHWQLSPTLSEVSQSHPQQSFTQSLFPKFHLLPVTKQQLPATQQSHSSNTKPWQSQTQNHSPSQPKSTSTASTLPQTQTQPSPTQRHSLHSQPPLPQTEHLTPQGSGLSTSDPGLLVVQQVTESDQIQTNASQQGDPAQSTKSASDSGLSEWLKRNTSQSPMTSNDPRVTQKSPSWLPVLEKHDIPIVVGVGVSLAFIFITMALYSLVQKNEPAPTCRAAERILGVPIRHAERWAAGRTYENSAFEDDDCVAVIEQSPNTSDTRAKPLSPSLVTVQMEPTSVDLHEDTQPVLHDHSVTVETYPEPIIDTKIDPSLEEEKGCSLSQPSIQLQCAEDWASSAGDNHSPCPDALPPPSSLPAPSPSPSPPSRLEEGMRSSFTLQTAEPYAAPIHHSLSISHGNPPLLLTHHVSLGRTTVAVDVHFFPVATDVMAVGTSTLTSSVSNTTSVTVPVFSPPLVNSQETDQSAARQYQSK